MKQLFSFFILAIAATLLSMNAHAKIWRLNNNGNNPQPAIIADFTGTLQAAHDNASVVSGDTIHIEQSPVSYGNCTFTKRLILIGPGYFLNTNPETQVNKDYAATVGNLIFYNVNAAGSEVHGLTTGQPLLGVDNLLINRCNITSYIYLGNVNANNINGLKVRQNYLNYNPGASQPMLRMNTGTGLITNVEISNNIFNTANGFGIPIQLDTKVSGILKNNILYGYYGISANNLYILNNIFYSSVGSANTFGNCVLEYNIGTATNLVLTPSGANNTIGTGNQIKTLAQIAFTTTNPNDAYWQLAPTSEAIAAGKDGANCGIFGGDYPYKLSGIPAVPNIYALSIAPISAGASTMSVNVTAKGNN